MYVCVDAVAYDWVTQRPIVCLIDNQCEVPVTDVSI